MPCAIRLRAARFGKDKRVGLDKKVSVQDNLNTSGDPDPDTFEFPEKDVEKIVENVVHFVFQTLMEKGVIALLAGATVIRLLPPLVISREEINTVVSALEELL